MKPFYNLLLLAALLLGGPGRASAQLIEWARLARNAGNNSGFAGGAAVDAAGNSYVGLVFKDSARVGTVQLRAVNGTQAVIKYDSTGRVAWVQQLANVFLDTYGLALDPSSQDVFVTGRFSTNPRWGGVAVAGGGNRNFYGRLAAATGRLSWNNSLPQQLNVETALAVDGTGNCYLLSQIDSVVTIAGMRLDSTRRFLVGARTDGSGQWVNVFRGVAASAQTGVNGRPYDGLFSGQGLAPRPAGGCYLYGAAITSVFYGPNPVAVANTATISYAFDYLLRVAPGGALVSAGVAPRAAMPVVRLRALAVDSLDNLYMTGDVSSVIGVGVAKYSAAGTLLWATNAEPTTGGFPGATGEHIAVHRNGEVTIQVYTALIAGRSPTTIGTLVLRSGNNLVRFSASGRPVWAVGDGTGQPPYSSGYCDGVAFGADRRGNMYWCLTATTSSATGPGGFSTTPPANRLGAFTLVGAGAVVARIGTRHNTVRGRIFLDQNGNGRRDAGDAPFPQTLVLEATRGTLSTFSSLESTGDYAMFLGTGAYALPAPGPPLHYTVSLPASGSYSGSFASYGGVDTARHFGYRPVVNQADLRVTLTPYGAARPGFLVRYRLTLENIGTTAVASGTASVVLDARLAYVGSTPAAARTGQTLAWTYANLAPFARREFDILTSLPVNTPLGTALSSTAAAPLPADVAPADNSSTAAHTVTGSFDPNDLSVNYQRLTPAQIAAAQPLDYTIRFQNMGTDTAFTVVLTDTLNFRKLSLNSLMLVAQSHNCLWSLSGAGLLTVRFLNIRLPHRGIDVIRSQGFVRFRVQPKPTLAVGDVIPNHGHIFFDYNAPIRTNTATTAVLLPTATAAARPGLAWEVYPNPATAAVTIAATLPTGGPVSLRLLDALGRPVRQQRLLAPAGPLRETLALHGLAPGVYVLQVALPGGTVSKRVTINE